MDRDPSANRPAILAGETGLGWSVRILPFIEQENIAKGLIHVELPIADPVNDGAGCTPIATFRCPIDTGDKTFCLEPGPEPKPNYDRAFTATDVTTANYVGVFGTSGCARSVGEAAIAWATAVLSFSGSPEAGFDAGRTNALYSRRKDP